MLSESTVKKHAGRVLAKVDARDRIQAVVLAYDLGLARPPQPGLITSRRSPGSRPATRSPYSSVVFVPYGLTDMVIDQDDQAVVDGLS